MAIHVREKQLDPLAHTGPPQTTRNILVDHVIKIQFKTIAHADPPQTARTIIEFTPQRNNRSLSPISVHLDQLPCGLFMPTSNCLKITSRTRSVKRQSLPPRLRASTSNSRVASIIACHRGTRVAQLSPPSVPRTSIRFSCRLNFICSKTEDSAQAHSGQRTKVAGKLTEKKPIRPWKFFKLVTTVDCSFRPSHKHSSSRKSSDEP